MNSAGVFSKRRRSTSKQTSFEIGHKVLQRREMTADGFPERLTSASDHGLNLPTFSRRRLRRMNCDFWTQSRWIGGGHTVARYPWTNLCTVSSAPGWRKRSASPTRIYNSCERIPITPADFSILWARLLPHFIHSLMRRLILRF
jgi:hypothetical protein